MKHIIRSVLPIVIVLVVAPVLSGVNLLSADGRAGVAFAQVPAIPGSSEFSVGPHGSPRKDNQWCAGSHRTGENTTAVPILPATSGFGTGPQTVANVEAKGQLPAMGGFSTGHKETGSGTNFGRCPE
jgi:hypothetical protein